MDISYDINSKILSIYIESWYEEIEYLNNVISKFKISTLLSCT